MHAQQLHASRTRVGHANRSRAAVLTPRAQAASAAATLPAGAPSSSWAIVKVAGVNQFVEVGRALALSSSSVSEATLGKLVRFKEVLAFKSQAGALKKGKPYLADVVVEGVVEDQFQGPSVGSPTVGLPAASSSPLTLSKVVITKIEVGDAAQVDSQSAEVALSITV